VIAFVVLGLLNSFETMPEEEKEEIRSLSDDESYDADEEIEDVSPNTGGDAKPAGAVTTRASLNRWKIIALLLVVAAVMIIAASILVPILLNRRNEESESSVTSSSARAYPAGDGIVDPTMLLSSMSPLPTLSPTVPPTDEPTSVKEEVYYPSYGGDGGHYPSTYLPVDFESFSPHSHYYPYYDDDVGYQEPPLVEECYHHDISDYGCSPCGEGFCMTKPNNYYSTRDPLFQELFSSYIEYTEDGDSPAMQCAVIEKLAISGEFNHLHGRKLEESEPPLAEFFCEIVPEFIWDDCGCKSYIGRPSPAPYSRPPTYYRPTYQPSEYDDGCPDDLGCGRRNSCGLTSLDSEEISCCENYAYDVWNYTTYDVDRYCARSFSLNASCFQNGQGDTLCKTGICHKGKCSNQRGQAGEICSESRDCQSGACGITAVDSTTTECCARSSVYYYNQSSYQYEYYCDGSVPNGDKCLVDDMCESRICVGGVCSATRLVAGSNCTESNDCLSYACGRESATATNDVCCPSRSTYDFWNNNDRNYTSYCRRTVELDEQCLFDDQCQSGICINETQAISTCRDERLDSQSLCYSDSHCKSRYCGYTTYGPLQGQNRYCCAGRAYYVEYMYEYASFCAGSIPEGEKCDINRYGEGLCSTGICVGGVCAAERLPYGEQCEVRSDCQTRACGANSFGYGGDKICCARALRIYDNSYGSYQDICTGSLSVNETCRVNERSYNELCESGFCVQGKCASERLGFGESCRESSDCKTSACGASSFGYGDQDGICCSSTLRIYMNGYAQVLCTRTLSLNETCSFSGNSYNELCETGICIQGKCASERLAVGESCVAASDCAGGNCGLSVYDRSESEQVCCQGDMVYFYYDTYNRGGSFCSRTVETGGSCPENNNNGYLICKSGICINGKCEDEKLEDGSACNFDTECDGGACALDVMDFGTRSMICCPTGQKLYMFDGFSYHYFCLRNTPLGGECNSQGSTNSGDLCKSGICIDDVCTDKRLNVSESCESNNECKSGACGYNDLDLSSREMICCEETCNIRVSDSYGYENYCTGILSMGDSCEWNTGRGRSKFPQLCPSGICVDGVCSEELRKTGDNCTHATECLSGSCGFSSFQQKDESSPQCCGLGSYSIYDGVCDNDDFCQRSFENGEQCSFRGSRYDGLCLSNYCTLEGVCGIRNETNSVADSSQYYQYYHEHEDDHAHHEEEQGQQYYNENNHQHSDHSAHSGEKDEEDNNDDV